MEVKRKKYPHVMYRSNWISKKMYSVPFCLLYFFLLIFAAFPQSSMAVNKFAPVRVKNAAICVDGILEEAVWRSIPPITNWYQLTPNEGEGPSEATEMWLIYDENAVYLGARLQVTHPKNIMTRTMERDSHSPDQDAIALILDTLNDNRTAYGFIVSPAGVRTDIAVFDDAENVTSPWNTDWNAFWEAASQQNENSWSVEMRIPFSSLRYKNQDGSVSMGLILWRYRAYNVEYDIFPAIPNTWRYSAYKPSQALDVKFKGVKTKHPIYIRPYTIGGVEYKNVLNQDSTDYSLQSRWEKDAGLDVKYNLTNNLILDVTLNTDFAQVEADDQQINLTRFSLFFPEKRPFFQERADLFNFRIPGGSHRLFHSRTIGIIEGQNVPIIGGIRLAGRIGTWEIGLIEMHTAAMEINGERLLSENFGVFRLKNIIKDDGSYVGGMITSRMDFNGHYNFVMAADVDLSLKKPLYFKMKLAQSVEPESDWNKSLLGSVVLHTRKRRGFSFGFSASHIGRKFNPEMGFMPRQGINRIGNRVGYFWYPEATSFIQSHGFTNRLAGIWETDSGKLETFSNKLDWEALFRTGASAVATFKVTQENLPSPFWIGKVEIDKGRYRFAALHLKYHTPSGLPLRLGVEAFGGSYYDGWQAGGVFAPSWTLSPNMTLLLEYNYSRAEVQNGIYQAHVARLRIKSAINRVLTASTFLQYSSDLRQISVNIRLRYNPTEGNDFYIVYNKGINTSLDDQIPPLTRRSNTTILIKYNCTFVL